MLAVIGGPHWPASDTRGITRRQLKGGEIVRRGVGFVDVKAVVVHVDRDAILAAAGVHDVELTAWDARRVVLGELIADLAAAGSALTAPSRFLSFFKS